MTIQFGKFLTGLDGAHLKENDNPITLGILACAALMFTYPQDAQLSAQSKLDRYALARRIYGAGALDVTEAECALLKNTLAQFCGVALLGAAVDAIEST